MVQVLASCEADRGGLVYGGPMSHITVSQSVLVGGQAQAGAGIFIDVGGTLTLDHTVRAYLTNSL